MKLLLSPYLPISPPLIPSLIPTSKAADTLSRPILFRRITSRRDFFPSQARLIRPQNEPDFSFGEIRQTPTQFITFAYRKQNQQYSVVGFFRHQTDLALESMLRKAQIDALAAVHHIIVRRIKRRSIFREDPNRKRFLGEKR